MRNKKRWLAMMLAAAMTITSVGVSPLSGIDAVYAGNEEEPPAEHYDYEVDPEFKIPDQVLVGGKAPDLMKVPELETITLTNGAVLIRGEHFKVTTTDDTVKNNATATFECIGQYAGKKIKPLTFKIIAAESTDNTVYTAAIDESKLVYNGSAFNATNLVSEDCDFSKALIVLADDYTKITPVAARTNGKVYVKVTEDAANKTHSGNAGEKYKVTVALAKGEEAVNDKIILEKTITIGKRDLSTIKKEKLSIVDRISEKYDGTEKKPAVKKVQDGSITGAGDHHVKVKVAGYSNNINATDSKKAEVKLSSDDDNYTGTVTLDFDIAKANLANAVISLKSDVADQVYTGSVIKPVPSIVAQFSSGSSKVIPASDYKFEYGNESLDNTAVGSNKGIIKIVPNSTNVQGSKECTKFNIVKADLSNVTFTAKKPVLPGETLSSTNINTYFKYEYNGHTVDSLDLNLTETTFDSVGDVKEIKVDAKDSEGKFKGSKTIKVTCEAKKMSAKYKSTSDTITYTGKPVTVVSTQLGIIGDVDNSSLTLRPGSDYVVKDVYTNNTNVGKATVEIEGINDYAGQKSICEFNIAPKDIATEGNKLVVEGLKPGFYSKDSEIAGLTVKVYKDTTYVKTLSSKDYVVKATEISSENVLKKLTVEGKGNYKGSKEVTLGADEQVSVDKADLRSATVTAEIPAGLTAYVKTEEKNETPGEGYKTDLRKYISVIVNGVKLDSDAFTIESIAAESGNPSDLGKLGEKVVVTLKAAGSQIVTGSTKKATLTIVKADITDLKQKFAIANAADASQRPYKGVAYTPDFGDIVEPNGVASVDKNDDYTITYKNNVNAGTATAIVTGIGNYKGSFEVPFKIGKITLKAVGGDANVVVGLPTIAERAYTGSKNDLSSKIYLKNKDQGKLALDKSDYTVTYLSTSDDTTYKAGSTVNYKIDVKNTTNYNVSTISASYKIVGVNVTDDNCKVTLDKTTMSKGDANPVVKSVVVNGKTVSSEEYTVSYIGTASVTSKENPTYVNIAFKDAGNYVGRVKVPFTVKAKELDLSQVRIKAPSNTVYNGSGIEAEASDPLGSVPTDSYTVVYYKDGKKLEGEPVNVGTYTATVVGDEAQGYTGTGRSVVFTITPYVISDAEWAGITFTLNAPTYAGENTKAPEIDEVNNTPVDIDSTAFEVISFDKNWDGTGTAMVAKVATKADANAVYKGEPKEVEFTFDKAWIYSSNVEDYFEIKPQTYTGDSIEPKVTAVAGTNVDPSWVKVKYYNYNVNISKKVAYAHVEINIPESNPFYEANGSDADIFFDINAASISSTTIEGIKDAEYTGKAITQKVEVTTADGLVLTLGKDYRVSYSNNVNPGTATVTITGCGNYTGEIVKTFKITKKETPVVKVDISKATVTGLKTVTYNGKAFKPAVKVVVNGKTLVLNKDYKVAYSNNIKPGTAKVVITGIGSYKGTVTKTFVIKKAAQSITKAVAKKTFKASNLKKKAATFSINAKAKGKITYKKTSGSKNITVSSSGKVTVKKGTKKGTYTIKVKITAAATSNFNKATVTKTIKVVVK